MLDLTRHLPGPLAARILGELGFPVRRLLPPQGDLVAGVAPAIYAWLNAGKDTETVDLKSPAGKERLLSLVREAQVLLESNRPGVMERLGLGPEVLRAANPRLVYVRIAGHRDPPFHETPGHDLSYLAAAGLLARFEQAWVTVQLADCTGAFWAALAALEGLSRGGGFYEVYLEEAARALAYPPLPFLDGSRVCYAIYPTRDGEVALAALEPHLWERFCRALGREEWRDAGFTPAAAPNPVYQELRSLFASRSALDWETWAQEKVLPLRALRPYTPPSSLLPWKNSP
ncbi:MAG: CoA transferase [Acidobacteria bacterium]|nr:CoA transferase [Acidobacteriota bacterium]